MLRIQSGLFGSQKIKRIDFKIVLLGDASVGKTSLILRYCHEVFRDGIHATIGVAFEAKEIKLSKGNKKLIAGIWDTAGLERYDSINEMYYRNANAAIICYDPCNKKTWDRAKHWLLQIRQAEEGCKLYLCATKFDILSNESVRHITQKDAMNYAEGVNAYYIETSSKTGHNVDELFRKVADDFSANPININLVENVSSVTLAPEKTQKQCCFR